MIFYADTSGLPKPKALSRTIPIFTDLMKRFTVCILFAVFLTSHAFAQEPVDATAALAEARDAVEDVVEPFLLQCGLIQRTPRGRVLSQSAWRHLGLPAPKGAVADLFGE